MYAVSPAIIKIILELQSLPSLSNFALGGGTNLAIQYNHRISEDIDMFCSEIIGKSGFQKIEEEVKNHFGNQARGFDDPCDINDQFCFLRFYVETEDGNIIKVELLQNMKSLYALEIIEDVQLLSKKDIGLFKLISTSNRSTKKDIYDLDFIKDEIPLTELFEDLKVKTLKFNKEEHKTIFDLNKNKTPIDYPELLLKFDSASGSAKFPMHTHDNINIIDGNKTWISTKISWRSKVRQLYNNLGLKFPRPVGMRIR